MTHKKFSAVKCRVNFQQLSNSSEHFFRPFFYETGCDVLGFGGITPVGDHHKNKKNQKSEIKKSERMPIVHDIFEVLLYNL